MCGIAGIIKFNEPVQLSSLKAMTDAIAHRGPDGEGQWIDFSQKVGLGHRRLSIIDLSDAASQPMHSACGNYTLVFNGEIYNYIELKEALVAEGEQFTTDSDTEVLLKLYIKYGAKCLDELDGMWAFAIWDEKKQELFCARDRFGEKPFHYVHDESGFYFASEMKALWAAGIAKNVNAAAVERFQKHNVSFNENDTSETFYEGISRLEHSHYLTLGSDKKITITRYYDLDYKNQNFTGTLAEAQEEFKRLLIESLKRRMRSDTPVGSSLSGGLDSTTIVCAIVDYLGVNGNDFNCFSARFKGFKKDEGAFIKQTVQLKQLNSFETWPDGNMFKNEFEKVCYHQEEPFGGPSIFAQYKVQELAKQHGVTVLIDGQGADEILAGYISYYPIYLKQLIKERHTFRKRVKEQFAFIDFHTPHQGIKKTAIKYSLFYEYKLRKELSRKKDEETHHLNKALYNSVMNGHLQELLRVADRNSMAHGREIRLPFLSKDLVEFCFRLPDSFKLNLGWTKYVMRLAFEDHIPPAIAWRKEKVGFEPPFNEWMKPFNTANWKELMLKTYFGSND